jgi:hypothetical protein
MSSLKKIIMRRNMPTKKPEPELELETDSEETQTEDEYNNESNDEDENDPEDKSNVEDDPEDEKKLPIIEDNTEYKVVMRPRAYTLKNGTIKVKDYPVRVPIRHGRRGPKQKPNKKKLRDLIPMLSESEAIKMLQYYTKFIKAHEELVEEEELFS